MSDSDDIDDAQATQIDQRLGQAFAFVRDMVDAPAVLDEIPDRRSWSSATWCGRASNCA